MKKFRYLLVVVSFIFLFFLFNYNSVGAAKVIASTTEELFGETVNTIKVYNNGKVTIQYKYGLRRVDMYYCEKGDQCDNDNYYMKNIVDSTIVEPNKNTGESLAKYEFVVDLEENIDYRVRIEAYFATSSVYVGGESIYGYPIGSKQEADTKENYINGEDVTASDGVTGDKRLNGLLDTIVGIVNGVLLPIIYIATGLYLVVKGTVLAVQIVKAADEPSIRREKIGAFKWLVIGVAIAYAATTVVGVVTGFFKNVFNS